MKLNVDKELEAKPIHNMHELIENQFLVSWIFQCRNRKPIVLILQKQMSYDTYWPKNMRREC